MSAAAVAPSPQKSISLKRPQTEGTPQSSTSVKSPDQSFKKARLNGDESNGIKDIGKGGRWMVEKLEELERLYKVCVAGQVVLAMLTCDQGRGESRDDHLAISGIRYPLVGTIVR